MYSTRLSSLSVDFKHIELVSTKCRMTKDSVGKVLYSGKWGLEHSHLLNVFFFSSQVVFGKCIYVE